MNNLSVVIMASRKREAWALELSKQLNNCPIAFDPNTRFNVSNIWENCKRAWGMQDVSKKWSLVIQDDAILCKDFLLKVQEHLDRAEKLNCAIQFYVGNNHHYQEQFGANIKNGYVIMPYLTWGVAIALPSELIPSMIAFGNSYSAWNDDIKIKYFLLNKQISTYYALPGLVDHRKEKENPSIVRSKGGDRFSNFFIDNI